MKSLTIPLLGLALLAVSVSAAPTTLSLWSAAAPGETKPLPPEADQTKPEDPLIAGRRIIKLGNVSHPTITFYPAPAATNTGAAVLVSPGGGYYILAYDLEGTEVCEWLNSIGVNAVLLKYRVPPREGIEHWVPPLQDAQRAMGLIREHATEWGIDPKRVGALGFSAGGHLTAMLSNHFETRTYPKVDAADELSCRPDFAVLIYPGGLADEKKGLTLATNLGVAAGKTPPTFLAMAEDDPVHVENALEYYRALKQAGIPAEMHLYPTGGHGYGLRRTKDLVTTWPDRVADWLRAGGWLKR